MSDVDSFDRIYARMLNITRCQTQVELAACLGIRQSSVSDVVRRKHVPPQWYLKLLDRLEISPDWLRWGRPPQYWRRPEGEAPGGERECPADAGEAAEGAVWTVVHTSDCGGVAEPGKDDLSRAGHMALPRPFIREDTLVVRLESGEAEPAIRKGALVGVDTADVLPRSGALYAFLLPYEGFSLRRVFFEMAGPDMVLRADNPSFPIARIPAEERAAHVLGRVWWVWQSL